MTIPIYENTLYRYVFYYINTDTQYVIVQKCRTKHIVYRHLPLHNYELILWTIS